ncbi:MAG TPA: beta-propeller fold lactonase family protein [Candidatus Acidoferrales bacterium]|nr:beta-propeller fold lactonase family protein [Candidatus Acidoferrales bacterium]
MAAKSGTASFGRNVLRNAIRMIPVVVLPALMLATYSCGNGLFPEVGSSSSGNATGSPTPGTGALAFVTNFNAGTLSSFTRNTTTGALKRTGTTSAGAKKGPKGVVAAVAGGFLYAANVADDNIYEFALNQSTGALTPLSPASVGNGSKSGPDEMVINPAGTLLFVTGSRNGTITSYTINTSTGQLTNAGKVSGLFSPFGIAINSTGSFLYVADNTAGLMYSYAINTSTGALSQNGPAQLSLGVSAGNPGFIAIDPAGTFLYVTDLTSGLISVFAINTTIGQPTFGQLTFGSVVPSASTANAPLGIAIGNVTGIGELIFTANQGTATVWEFFLQSPGFPAQPVAFGAGNLSQPTDLVVDPQNKFVYVTNQGAGTVSEFALNANCPNNPSIMCFVASVATESGGGAAASGPFGITLAN